MLHVEPHVVGTTKPLDPWVERLRVEAARVRPVGVLLARSPSAPWHALPEGWDSRDSGATPGPTTRTGRSSGGRALDASGTHCSPNLDAAVDP